MMVGEEYKASLFDGRATSFERDRVEDLPGHPILGVAVGHAAAGYDWMAAHAVDGKSPRAGGWRAVTNIQAGGGLYAQRIVTRKHYDLDAAKERALLVAGLNGNGH